MRHFLFGKVMIILTEKADCKMFIVILWSYNKDFDAAHLHQFALGMTFEKSSCNKNGHFKNSIIFHFTFFSASIR